MILVNYIANLDEKSTFFAVPFPPESGIFLCRFNNVL